MRNPIRRMAFSWLAFSSGLALLLLSALSTPTLADTIADHPTASVLFSDYEIVFFSNTDFSSHLSAFKGLPRATAEWLSLPFSYLIGALDSVDPYASEAILRRSDSLMFGTRNII